MKAFLQIILFVCIIPFSYAQLLPVASGVFHWANGSAIVEGEGDGKREIKSILEGTCSGFKFFAIYAVTEKEGVKPPSTNINKDIEQLIIVKEGKVRVTIGTQNAILGAGGVALIAPKEKHRLENVGHGPLTYYVIKYQSEKSIATTKGESESKSLLLNKDSLQFNLTSNGGRRNYFDQHTTMCENAELHVSQLIQKGPGHAPHSHIDNELIIVIAGTIKVTIDTKPYVGTGDDLCFINSDEKHSVANNTDEPCMYFALRWR